ncbi:MAG: ABC transporter substrate-binding protein [Clostridiales bacterium]|nr:ABC transporter substrate-binding protein [Clostridiales bacterium]
MRKKLLSAVLAATMVFGMTAAPLTASADDEKTVVNVGIAGTVTDISPASAPDTNEYPIQYTLYQRLFTTPSVSSEELIPIIGKSYELVEGDTLTAEIEIYDYVHDNDGNAITVDDVIFSYETYIAAATQTDTAYIDSMEKIDDYTFQLTLTEDATEATMIKLVTHLNIFSQTAYEENPETTTGTSPYKLTSYTSGSEYVCEKVDDYWQTDELNAYDQQANVDKIVFQCIPETSQMTTALETGEIQMAINVDALEAQRFEEGGENEDGYSVDTHSGSFTNVLLFNDTEDSLCSDENLRKAILYALNKEAIISIVLNGAGNVAKDMASSALIGYQDVWEEEDYYSYDADLAAQYLAESSYNGETLKLQSSSGNEDLLALMQAQLSAAGITVEIATYENALWQTLKVAGTGESDWDLCVDGLGGSRVTSAWKVKFNPDNFSTGLPQTGTTDETVVELLNTAVQTEEAEDLQAFHDYVVENAYAVGLYASAEKCVTVDTITDICYSYMGYVVPASCNYDNYTVTE